MNGGTDDENLITSNVNENENRSSGGIHCRPLSTTLIYLAINSINGDC